MGGTKSPLCNKLAKNVWMCMCKMRFGWLHAICLVSSILRQTKAQDSLMRELSGSSVCVVTTLKEYLVRTKAVRGSDQSQLLISHVKPYKPVSRDTVTRWVRCSSALAGIDITQYSAHSTKAARFETGLT